MYDQSELSSKLTPPPGKDGRPETLERPFYNGAVPEITERRLINNVLYHSTLVLWAVDMDGVFFLSRGKGLRYLGLEDDEVIGMNVFEMYADSPEICEKIQRVMKGEEIHDLVEVNNQTFETWYCPIWQDDGTISGVVGFSCVVSELCKARQTLKEMGQQLRTTFFDSPSVMIILEKETNTVLEANKSFEAVTGFSAEDVRGIGLNQMRLFPENLATMLLESHDEETFDIRNRDGEIRRLTMTAAEIRYQAMDCLMLTGRDITNEMQAWEALEKSEKRFENLARQAPVGIFQCDRDGRLFFTNQYFLSCFNFPGTLSKSGPIQPGRINELIDLNWHDLFSWDESTELVDAWRETVRQERSFKVRVVPRYPAEGVEMILLQIDQIERDRFAGVIVDMTAVHRAESVSALRHQQLEKAVQARTAELNELNQQLREEVESKEKAKSELQLSRNRMKAVLENVVDSICWVDREGRIEYINRMRSGVPKGVIEKTKIFQWIDEKNREASREALRKVLQTGEVVELEADVDLPNGEKVTMTARWGPIWNNGEVVGATIVATDVTRVRELEAASKRRQEELAHLSRLTLMGEMSARLSHELKQPLQSITAYASGCLRTLEEEEAEPEQVIRTLGQILRLANESNEIVNKTRGFVQKRPFQKKPTTIEALVDRTLELISGKLTDQTIVIQRKIAEDLPEVVVDPTQIQQVFMNLLLNAIDAIQSSSKQDCRHQITITAEETREGFVSVRIADTGDGFAGQKGQSMFEAFKSSKPDGLGMGLAICRGILENHLGEFRLNETSPEGTEFQVDLPIGNHPNDSPVFPNEITE